MRGYETFSTTADAGLRARGRTYGELYGNALRGLNLLLFGRNPRRSAGGESIPFRFCGDGPENVLVNLLSEALRLACRQGRCVAAADFRRAGLRAIDARLRLARCARAPRLDVKAVTYHNLRVTEKNGVLSVRMVMDI